MRKSTTWLAFLLSAVIIYGCRQEIFEPQENLEDYTLYSLFLDSLVSTTAVIDEESYSSLGRITLESNYLQGAVEYFNFKYPGINTEIIDQLSVVDQDSMIYENKFELGDKEVIMTNWDELSDILTGGYQSAWQQFFARFGQEAQRVALTRVSYNNKRDKAVFAASIGQWSYLGYVVYLEKEGSQWLIKDYYLAWTT